ncbi:uncharacterized protein P884DRAFT_255750 [Thermothelomyces heterothallicus CBS 202.75]|uniref:uncharacterized protein n=1 Tax=Thermothelomyces heterothallicus CBS 202.75 TaxID=1149848 RepID=UPI003742D71C
MYPTRMCLKLWLLLIINRISLYAIRSSVVHLRSPSINYFPLTSWTSGEKLHHGAGYQQVRTLSACQGTYHTASTGATMINVSGKTEHTTL